MHKDVLAYHKHLHLIPGDQLVLRKGRPVIHHLFPFHSFFFIDKVAYQHVQRLLPIDKLAQDFQDLFVCFFIYPVVAVNDLKIDPCSVSQACVDRFSMASIFLMDRPADVWIISGVFIRDLAGTVLCGTVVNDQYLHLVPAREQALNAMAHIIFRIIAWDCD